MQGFQLTFFTRQDVRHGHHRLADWLVQEARQLGMAGATLVAASEGFGRDGRLHSVHFVDLSDQPLEVTMAVSAQECEAFFAHLRTADVNVFYVKAPIEFGMTAER